MDSHAQAAHRALPGTSRLPARTTQLRRARDHRHPDRGGLGRLPGLDRRGNRAEVAGEVAGEVATARWSAYPGVMAQCRPGETTPRNPPTGRSDAGLFGPTSVTWRVMGEPIMWVAGLRAMYLQALHPRTMRATWQNTAFARPGEAWGRFERTVDFVKIRTYGTLAQVDRAGRRVRKVHASLTGVDADGSVIRLDEPELLLWVHCGEIDSYVNVASRCGMR